jgi:hypothetical protein
MLKAAFGLFKQTDCCTAGVVSGLVVIGLIVTVTGETNCGLVPLKPN